MKKPKILISVDWFEPGYKAGGPIRSCLNLSRALKENYQIYIITSDTDFGDFIPYESIKSDEWTKFEDGIEVFYFSTKNQKFRRLKDIIKKIDPDFIYLNSIFSIFFAIQPLIIKWLGIYKNKLIIAPRGMLHKGALRYKSIKKKIFIVLFRIIGLHRNITFQATDNQEEKDIYLHFGKETKVCLIPNISDLSQPVFQPSLKVKNQISILFCSRISPKKNLLFLLKVLEKVSVNVKLSIVGPVQDKIYWDKCRKRISQLPANIQIEFKGEIPHKLVKIEIVNHNLFCLPTLGENFGHSIIEAFINGRPALISTNTPWRDLKKKRMGWDIPLDKPDQYVIALETFALMEQKEFSEWSLNAWIFANNMIKKPNLKGSYCVLFT